MTTRRISAPAPMTSTRPGCITGSAARRARVAVSSPAVTDRTPPTGMREPWMAAASYSGSARASAATVVTDPASPTSVAVSSTGTSAATSASAARTSASAACTSSGGGGSLRRWRSVSRTQPTSTERAARTPEASPSTNSVEPPPMSTTR